MKKFTLLSTVALLASGAAVAQPAFDKPMNNATNAQGQGMGQGRGMGPRGPQPAQIFKKLDSNQDGTVTKDEMFEAHKARFEEHFKEIDENSDGKVTLEEMETGKKKMRGKMKERMKKWRDNKGPRKGMAVESE